MKASFLIENINKTLPFVYRAVSSKSSIPALSCFLIKATKKGISIDATDLEIGIRASVLSSVTEEGEALVPAKTFMDAILSIPSGKIALETDERKINIVSQKAKMSIQTISKEDFPEIYNGGGGGKAVFTKKEQDKIFKKVVFSAGQEELRQELCGILIDDGGKEERIVATDGYRLSLYQTEKKEGKGEGRKLVSARPLREVLSISSEEDMNMQLLEKTGQAVFEKGDIIVVGRLLDENKYPKYEKIIPGDFLTRAVVGREDLLQAVRTSAVFSKGASSMVKFVFEKNGLTVLGEDSAVGRGEVSVDASVEGKENRCSFNSKYVVEALSNIDSKEIVFEMTGPLSPCVFKTDEEEGFLHIIMPVRTGTED